MHRDALECWPKHGHGKRLLPADAHSVQHARFRYRLSNRSNWERVTSHEGKSMTYERDGDGAIVEEWLRQRKYLAIVWQMWQKTARNCSGEPKTGLEECLNL